MSRFARNVATLGIGNVVAQVISIGAVPLIARLYSPSEYGIFSIYAAATMIIAPVAPLQYQSAILLPGSLAEAAALLRLSVTLVLLFGTVLVPSVLLMMTLLGVIGHSGLGVAIWIIPVGVIVLGMKQIAVFWTLRCEQFEAIAGSAIAESIVDRGIVIGLGLWGMTSAVSLIGGRVVGPLVSITWMLRRSISSAGSWSVPMRSVARRYRDFPLFSAPAVLLNAASRNTPTLILALLFSPTVAGLYALGVRVMSLPMMIIGDSIAKVYRQQIAKNITEKIPVAKITESLFGYLLLGTLPIAIFLMFFGPQLFVLIFGSRWLESGVYVQVLMPAFVGLFIHRVLSGLFDVMERQRQRLMFDGVTFVACTLGIVIPSYIFTNPLSALFGYLAVSTVVNTAAFLYFFSIARVPIKKFWLITFFKMASATPLVLGLAVIKVLFSKTEIEQIIFGAFFLALHAVIIVILDRNLREFVVRLMFRKKDKQCKSN